MFFRNESLKVMSLFFIYFTERKHKITKNVFYFTEKALFVLKLFEFSLLFTMVEFIKETDWR